MAVVSTNLDIRRVTGRIGAEIVGLDLRDALGDDTVIASIRAALVEHKALFFRGQELDDAGQQRFAARFGALTTAHPTVPSLAGSPNVLRVDSTEGRANNWHTDVTFVVSPPAASTLRAVVIPPAGGDTLIANSVTAYQDLRATCANWPTGSGRSTATTTTTRSRGPRRSRRRRTARSSSPGSTGPPTRWFASIPRRVSGACSSAGSRSASSACP